ncbi:adenosylmethionine--8-amino-7-oxononanoate transaminase [Halodesulfovibrio spirochaetisodalis]|uniref:Adenosylmethionine-8-amino-7-oxononanoate aminotransferase n=1 Tax=Halodesulfovibrio spirochaetisodalis TaxID=1560234 RepID=A0A1B7XAP3_9BACT|nr:adenosylmethionine--8-amino-7-oxononanoate transaminase [Halodesulfovibrio spirochaetisodalis]OBQ46439.1 adenosylmethionine-8-amino-7-oxononanoate aminotransferase [Halodesulfovibrio spirochaetisodalis]
MSTTQDLQTIDRTNVWHPFTQMAEWVQQDQLIIESGKDNWLIDTEGNRYLDGISSLWTNVHGHCVPEIDNAVQEQLGKIAHTTMLGLANVPATELAKRLVDILPQGLTRVFYSDSGSTAVEVALKIAFQFQQQAEKGDPNRIKFISMQNSYHGDTIGSVAVGGMDLFHATYKHMLFQGEKVLSPYCYRCPFGKEKATCDHECFQHVEDVLSEHGSTAAAFVIEPLVQGAAGQIMHPEGYLAHVRELCTRHNVLLIADEVAVGFGKTGTMFACEQENITPDIICLAKGISAGYLPLAATVASEEIYNGFLGKHEEFKTFFHGHTYTGNPLACAAAIANLDYFENNNVMEKLQPKIAHLQNRLNAMQELEHVGEIRIRGIMTGIELVKDKGSKASFEAAAKIGHRVCMEARKYGVIIRNLGDVIILMPPLSISLSEIDLLCDATAKAISTVTE